MTKLRPRGQAGNRERLGGADNGLIGSRQSGGQSRKGNDVDAHGSTGSVSSVGPLRSISVVFRCPCSSGGRAVVRPSFVLVSRGGSRWSGGGSFSAVGSVSGPALAYAAAWLQVAKHDLPDRLRLGI